jgi:hypothetical protein
MKYLIIIGAMMLLIFTFMILENLNGLLKEFRNRTKAQTLLLIKDEHSLSANVAATTDLLQFVVYLIDVEISERVSLLTFMRQRYNMQNIDKDVQVIGEHVFQSIKKEVLVNSELIVGQDYLMKFISVEVTLRLTAQMTEHNIAIAPVQGIQE